MSKWKNRFGEFLLTGWTHTHRGFAWDVTFTKNAFSSGATFWKWTCYFEWWFGPAPDYTDQ